MSFIISGFGKATPEAVITNARMSEIVDTDDEWITSRTGIKTRRISSGETLCDLASAAAQAAIKSAGAVATDVDYIICSTVQGDFLTPSLACQVQGRIGAKCPAFDLNAACSGFIYALDIAASLFDSGRAETVLVVSAEMMSRHVDWSDRATCVLFGDGAGAVFLRKGDGLRSIVLSADGNDGVLNIPVARRGNPFGATSTTDYALYMQGSEVFKFAVSHMTADSKQAMEMAGISSSDVKRFLPHQANARIIRTSQKSLGFTDEQVAVNIHKYGNTSSATIPILLAELMENGEVSGGDYILLSAMGGGLTSGACVIKL